MTVVLFLVYLVYYRSVISCNLKTHGKNWCIHVWTYFKTGITIIIFYILVQNYVHYRSKVKLAGKGNVYSMMTWSWGIPNALMHLLLLHWHGNFIFFTKFSFLVHFDRTNISCSSFHVYVLQKLEQAHTEESLLPFILIIFHSTFLWMHLNNWIILNNKRHTYRKSDYLEKISTVLIYKMKLILLHIELKVKVH